MYQRNRRSIAKCHLAVALAGLLGAAVAHAHGHLSEPASRIVLCAEGKNANCNIDSWRIDAMESGKFFPATQSGLPDSYARDDVRNDLPPPDGHLAGTSVNGNLPVLDEQSADRWTKVPMQANALQTFKWQYSAVHAARRWNYFITRPDWNPGAPLTRAQFEEKPFCSVQNDGQPYWSADLTPAQPTVHECRLPDRNGYQVIIAAWEVANTGKAFYQVVDAYFTSSRGSSVVRPF